MIESEIFQVLKRPDPSEDPLMMMGIGVMEGPGQADSQKYLAAVEQISDPFLKAVFLVGLSDDSEPRLAKAWETLQPQLTSEKPEVNAYLLAIGVLSKQEKWVDASAWLERARSLPMGAATRKLIDTALVGNATVGIKLDLDSPEYAPVKESAKLAVMRLRRDNLSAEERQEILDAMATLGLTQEAEKMEQDLAASSSGGSSSGRIFASPSRASTSSEKELELLEKMVSAGDLEGAAQKLSLEFSRIARSQLGVEEIGNS